ncbi:mitochondrial carrier protein [Polychytrium aggregatum]|uniref:mitochondrial carrier protein n=1 Tax=Polychytrium aggregatum TaxID=110093 RepID=UPI0022FF2E0C|nr:mitochondrial carrier protein [Polychytrium aggregatum]KAI9206300.1 mitochondrial carrier protein [Polychytrium aggregatum]
MSLAPRSFPPPTVFPHPSSNFDQQMEAKSVTQPQATMLDRYIGFIAGVCSGATKLAVGHPFDTIKVRMQTEGGFGRFKGPLDCLVETVKKEGFRGLYKGATPPLLGWALMDSVQMGSLTNFRLLLQGGDRNKRLTVPEHALAGFGAGLVVSFVATPVELLKGKLQVQYDAKTKVYSGPIDCARQLIRDNGIRGLWKGLAPCMLFRSFFWVLWGSYEVYVTELKKYKVHDRLVPFFAGGLAATTFWCVSFPFDVVKTRIMTQPEVKPLRYPSTAACFRYILRTEGIKGFYRGFLPCFLRSFPTNAAAIFVFDNVMKAGHSFSQ